MASFGSDDHVPAAMAVNDLVEARDGVARLRILLLQLDEQRAAWAQLEIDAVLAKLSSAISALDTSEVGRSRAAGPDGARPQRQQSGRSGGNKRKQGSSRRSQRPSDKKITATLEDGHEWRKYGQKEIQDSSYPRSYYRCTHKADQGCNAKRQVQRCETDASTYVVTYYGEHTCRDLSSIPLIHQAAAARAEEPDDDRANNLISFGSNSNNAASNGASSSQQQYQLAMGRSAADHQQQLSTSWCTSDDVFSSSAGSFMQVADDQLIGAVVVGSAGVASSAPDRAAGTLLGGGVASGGGGGGGGAAAAGSFPPSPNSLDFVVGSLGSIGGGEDDEDMFRLDP